MTVTNFNTTNQTWRQLLGGGLSYIIPKYQRDYSWTQDEWEDLWQDIHNVLSLSDEPAHYMGYLVLQTKDNKIFEVIDGQQRLTTLSLLALAVIKCLQDLIAEKIDAENNSKRIEQLRNTFIGYLDPVTLVVQSKLTLNKNNNSYYSDFIVPLAKLPQRNLRTSEHQLRKAFEWFYERVKKDYGQKSDGKNLAKFIEDLSDKLFFTVITVTDELNAFKVFETLNARGVRLSPTDLLKNYLFSVASRENPHQSEIDALERRWESMVGKLGGESFSDFLRTHWNSRRRFVRTSDLFKTIRSETPDKKAVFELLRSMEEDIDLYAALANPDDDIWDKNNHSQHIRELRMFSVRQPWPLLISAHRMFDKSGFSEILRACSIISFRYNVIGGLASNEQERLYNNIAQQISSKELPDPASVIKSLGQVYLEDDKFTYFFGEKVFKTTSSRNKQIVRYILFQIESHITHRNLDSDSPKYSIEHILPENPDANWSQFSDQQFDQYLYRLGNMTLLESGANKDLGNSAFDKKREVYKKSDFEITKKLSNDNDVWNVDRLASRQKWLAKQATSLWRISQLS